MKANPKVFRRELDRLVGEALDADVDPGEIASELHASAGTVDRVFVEDETKPGLYWVQIQGKTTIAEYSDRWFGIGGEVELSDDEVSIISGPLVAPRRPQS